MNRKKTKVEIKLYPFIIGVSPVLILFANNLGEVGFSEILRSLLSSIALTMLAILVCWTLLRDWSKARLLSTVAMITILTYGHVYDGLKETEVLISLARHRFLLVLTAMFVLGFGLFLWKKIVHTEPFEQFFTWFGIFILISPVYAVGSYYLQSDHRNPIENQEVKNISIDPSYGFQGDIYYIVLDEYGRADMLKELYEFDNSDFTNQLSELGFYVAPGATSNYSQTLLSLGASLNYQYLDETLQWFDPSSNDRRKLIDYVAHSRVRQLLEDAGYQFVAFDSGYVTSIEDADIYYKYLTPKDPDRTIILSMNSFEGLMLEKSIIRPLLDFGLIPQSSMAGLLETPYIRHAERILFAFEKLDQIPNMEGNYFVFAHIVAPHPPFVFGPNGEFLLHTTPYKLGEIVRFEGAREDYIQAYKDEVTYINSLVLKTVTKILAESDTPPIVIIQGDHGPSAYLDWESSENSNMRDRFGILSAFYMGGNETDAFYPTISSVNTFRIVLNEFFGMDLQILPDRNYFSLWGTPFRFEEVTDEVNAR